MAAFILLLFYSLVSTPSITSSDLKQWKRPIASVFWVAYVNTDARYALIDHRVNIIDGMQFKVVS